MTFFDIIIAAAGSIAVVVAAVRAINWWIARRAALNRMFRTASDDFYEAAEKMLKTPDDLPAETLDSLEFMSRMLNEPHGERRLLRTLRRLPGGVKKPAAAQSVMRPELRELENRASVAWLAALMARDVFYAPAIYREVIRLQIAEHQAGVTPAVAGSAARSMATGASERTDFCPA